MNGMIATVVELRQALKLPTVGHEAERLASGALLREVSARLKGLVSGFGGLGTGGWGLGAWGLGEITR